MKNLLILAALVAAASLSQASAQAPAQSGPNGQGESVTCPQNGRGNGARRQGRRGRAGQRGGQRGQRGQRGARKGRRGQGGQRGRGRRGGRRGRGGCGGGGSAFALAGPVSDSQLATLPPARLQAYLDALQTTLERELYARDYYTAADQVLVNPPRFGNIAGAEQHHADLVADMITYLGGTPVPSHDIPVVAPTSVAEADATCQAIELLVIGIYDRLIRGCVDPSLLPTLESIQRSNYQHLFAVGG